MEKVKSIFQTSDYGLFSNLQGNRQLSATNLKRLEKSFSEQYLICPIAINEKYEIIDGQHRFFVAKKLGLPINFYIVEGYGVSQVQRLNSNMKNWTPSDYLEAYVSLGNPEYIKFKGFMKDYPEFTITAASVILAGSSNGFIIQKTDNETITKSNKSGRYNVDGFKQGIIKIDNYEHSCLVADKIRMIKPYFDSYSNTNFVRSICSLLTNPNYNHEEFIKKLSNRSHKLEKCRNIELYKELIETIYNYRRRKKVSLRF